MRLSYIAPTDLTAEQQPLYQDMHAGISKSFNQFKAIRNDGALMGPWNPWLHFPKMGGPVWELTKAVSAHSTLPEPVKQIAILVTGAHFRAAYELYAHVAVAEVDKLDETKLITICAGQRPANLTAEEALAYDVAAALVGGGVLAEVTYRAAVRAFGENGATELSYLVGLYCMVSVTLNTFDVPVPE